MSCQSVRKWLSYFPKASKMSIGKHFNSFCDESMQHRKIKIAPLNSPSNISIERKCFYGKNNNFEIFIFFTRISHNHVLTFKLTLISHLTFFKKISTHLNLHVMIFRLPASVYFCGPSFLSQQRGNIPPAPRVRLETPAPRGLKSRKKRKTFIYLKS